ncbi:MAG: hypothetical protein IJ409_01075 [Lachnospiraceae bacterium]|nr:hypothetical protein [Lachnospiraceae bacterium]
MGETFGLMFFLGIIVIGIGIFLYKNPGIIWELSWERRRFLKGGEPTDHYYSYQKTRGVIFIALGIIMIIVSISMWSTEAKGYVVKIDGNDLKIPCTYADVEALGYQIDPAEEIETLRATSKNIKNSSTFVVKNVEGKEMTITFENRGDVDKAATECELIAITVRDENGPKIKLPNGVKNGMSEDDVKSVMGKGTPKGVGGSAAEYRERVSFNTYKINIVYDGSFMSRKVKSIRVEELIY